MRLSARRAGRLILWIFAVIGLFYAGITILATVVLPRVACVTAKQSTVMSTDGQFFAEFTQSICPARHGTSTSEVTLRQTANPKVGQLAFRFPPTTTDVSLTWLGGRKLLITVPEGTPISGRYANDWGVEVGTRIAGQPTAVFQEPIPSSRNIALNPPERQEEFKHWLTANNIPFHTTTIEGQEYVVWGPEYTDRVLKYDHISESVPPEAHPAR